MRKVYVNDNLPRTQLVRSALESEGIDTFLKYENSAMSLWDIIPNWPEVWILDDTELDHATEIVADLVASFQRNQDGKKLDRHWLLIGFIILGGPLLLLLPIEAIISLLAPYSELQWICCGLLVMIIAWNMPKRKQ